VTLSTDRALSRQVGGTGASVSTMADLRTHLGRGAADGFAPLDSGLLIPVQYLTDFSGATQSAAGTKGGVPQPAAADHRSVLRGDGTWSKGDVAIQRIVDDQATPAIAGLQVKEIQANGGYPVVTISNGSSTGENQHVMQSAAVGFRRARQGTRATGGTPDPFVDLQLEPTAFGGGSQPCPLGRVTVWGDPVELTIKTWHRLVARELGTTFDALNIPAPTNIETTAAAAEYDADGYSYVALAYSTSTGTKCGISWTGNNTLTKPRLNPELLVHADWFPTNGRVWVGWGTEDPTALVYNGTYTDFASITTPSVTQSDITFNAATKQITRGTGDWVADGFVVGMAINIAGANGANNSGIKRVNAVTTTALTVDESLTTNSDVVSVTISRRWVGVGLWWDSTQHAGLNMLHAVACDGTAQTDVETTIDLALAAANPAVWTIRRLTGNPGTYSFGRWDYTLGTFGDWIDLEDTLPPLSIKLGLAVMQYHVTDSTARQLRIRQIAYR
jgi:hypothetical protein